MRGFQRTRVSAGKVAAGFGLMRGARHQLLRKQFDVGPLARVEARIVDVEAIRFSHSNYLSENDGSRGTQRGVGTTPPRHQCGLSGVGRNRSSL
jgi:hypothetical protein